MNYEIGKDYLNREDFLKDCVFNFDSKGEDFGNQKRNSLKLFQNDGLTINIKSFRVPNLVNQIVYRFFRKSKAQRSFEYANALINLGIGTPQPIAYFEFPKLLFFKRSFYISEQLDVDLTFRELSRQHDYPDHENILRAFTRFTYKLHENNVLFLDHSPGNTLIKKVGNDYDFYLVDLNRMTFKTLSLDERIKNFQRLTKHESLVKTMSDEYAKCLNEDSDKIFRLMWASTQKFREKLERKKELKKKVKI